MLVGILQKQVKIQLRRILISSCDISFKQK